MSLKKPLTNAVFFSILMPNSMSLLNNCLTCKIYTILMFANFSNVHTSNDSFLEIPFYWIDCERII